MSFVRRLFGKRSDREPGKTPGEQDRKTAAPAGEAEAPDRKPGGACQKSDDGRAKAEERFMKLFMMLAAMATGQTEATGIDRARMEELQEDAKTIWDSEPRRVDAQVIHLWACERLKNRQGPYELSREDGELIHAVVFAIAALMASSEGERVEHMQQALLHVRRAGDVGGASILNARLSHTLGPMGKLP